MGRNRKIYAKERRVKNGQRGEKSAKSFMESNLMESNKILNLYRSCDVYLNQ